MVELTKRNWWRAAGLASSFGIVLVASLQSPTQASQRKPQTAPTSFGGDVKPLIQKYCVACHSGKEPVAGLDLASVTTPDEVLNDADHWSKVVDRLSKAQMPPQGSSQPGEVQRRRAIDWIKTALQNQCKLADPGRVTIRRLNRVEYDNTVRDLTGVNFHAADDFPSDDVGYGFDDIGDVLSISPLLMEKYLAAAEKIARQIVPLASDQSRHLEMSTWSACPGASQLDDGFREFYTNSTALKTVEVPLGGKFHIKTLAYGDQAGPDPARMVVSIDRKPVASFDVKVEKSNPTTYEAPVAMDPGKHEIGVSFANDYYNTKDPVGHRDRNLYVRYVEVLGESKSPQAPQSPVFRHLIPSEPSSPEEVPSLARQDIRSFATRAFRRELSDEEMDRLYRLFETGYKSDGSFDGGMRLVVEGVLVSPDFLFRVELDPKNGAAQVRSLTDYELASRLSYFLWSSTPDDELLELAHKGQLHKEAILNQQVKRMLADTKAQALADNFAGQWLQLRKLAIIEPNPKQFPGIDDTMKGYMATETKMFFNAVLQENRPITDFIDANYSYLNEPLAKLYGIEGVHGDSFQKVEVQEPRGGVITQASVLTVTSNPTRTSPTKRGKWLLEQILGAPPPPPPPGVAQINDEKKAISGATIRQLMEEHRKNPMCAACHQKMDPLGFGLENFDAVGQWRTKEGSFPIDSSGTLPTGVSFKGASELKKILLNDKDDFAHALAEKLLTYGLGRGMESADKCAIDDIVKKDAAEGYRFETLVIDVVDSDPFRKRKGEAIKS